VFKNPHLQRSLANRLQSAIDRQKPDPAISLIGDQCGAEHDGTVEPTLAGSSDLTIALRDRHAVGQPLSN
jgi:hypothetical protein